MATNSNDKPDNETLRLAYKNSKELFKYYGKIVWQIGSIFIVASLGAFAYAIQNDLQKVEFVPLILVPITLMMSFYFLFKRYRKNAHVEINRSEWLENELKLRIPQFECIDKNKPFYEKIPFPSPAGWLVIRITLFLLIAIFTLSIWRHEICQILTYGFCSSY